jgi:hypothetical protein
MPTPQGRGTWTYTTMARMPARRSVHSFVDTFAKQNGELGLGHGPPTQPHSSLLLGPIQDEIEQLQGRVVGTEAATGADGAAQPGVLSLDGVRTGM